MCFFYLIPRFRSYFNTEGPFDAAGTERYSHVFGIDWLGVQLELRLPTTHERCLKG